MTQKIQEKIKEEDECSNYVYFSNYPTLATLATTLTKPQVEDYNAVVSHKPFKYYTDSHSRTSPKKFGGQ